MPRTLANAPIMILNGPNLNLLGQRQPEIYGSDTLADVEALCAKAAAGHGGTVDFRQSNHEGELVDWIHEARLHHAGIVINPGAYSHTSVAILDALNTCDGLPVLEVHISNIHQRETFRHHSYVSLRADGVIAGAGCRGTCSGWSGSPRWWERRPRRPDVRPPLQPPRLHDPPQEPPGPVVLRVAEHLLGRAAFPDHAVVEEADLVGDVAGEPHLVRGQHHGHAVALEVAYHRQHLADQLRVERRGDLVEQQQPGP